MPEMKHFKQVDKFQEAVAMRSINHKMFMMSTALTITTVLTIGRAKFLESIIQENTPKIALLP